MPSRPEPRARRLQPSSRDGLSLGTGRDSAARGRLAALLAALLLAGCAGDPEDSADTTGDSGGGTDAPTDAGSEASGDAPTGGGEWMSLDERPCPEDSPLTAENFGGPFMLSHCTGCHHSSLPAAERAGAPAGIDFDKLGDVRKHAERIWARAADQNMTMPPLGGPPQDERTRLGEWLACGAPEAGD